MTKKELFEAATDPKRSLDERYAAAREMQSRTFPQSKIADLVRMYPVMTVSEIAEGLGLRVQVVKGMVSKLGLYKAS